MIDFHDTDSWCEHNSKLRLTKIIITVGWCHTKQYFQLLWTSLLHHYQCVTVRVCEMKLCISFCPKMCTIRTLAQISASKSSSMARVLCWLTGGLCAFAGHFQEDVIRCWRQSHDSHDKNIIHSRAMVLRFWGLDVLLQALLVYALPGSLPVGCGVGGSPLLGGDCSARRSRQKRLYHTSSMSLQWRSPYSWHTNPSRLSSICSDSVHDDPICAKACWNGLLFSTMLRAFVFPLFRKECSCSTFFTCSSAGEVSNYISCTVIINFKRDVSVFRIIVIT